MTSLKGKTLFITGASRGIGLAIARRAAKDGANIAIAAKTDKPHPKLKGTIHTAAAELESLGGKALPLVVDVRDEEMITNAVNQTAEHFGGIDICINNASAISLTSTTETELKRFDLMHQVNTRGTFLVSKACIPHLKKAENPHILNISPPLDMQAKWFAPHVAYSIAKFGMSLCVLGMAEELKSDGIAVNALWPRTAIATAAVEHAIGSAEAMKHCRNPTIMADAAHAVLIQPARTFTGQFLIDDTWLSENGVTDFDQYRMHPNAPLYLDFFVPENAPAPPGANLGAHGQTLSSS